MTRVTLIGCGVVGAMTAYELSHIPGLKITVLDRQPPAQACTAAALGVLMGVISHKVKGRQWQLRRESLARYEQLIPELEAATGQHVPFNRQGILKLLFEGDDWERWRSLQTSRQDQGFALELLDRDRLQERYPQVNAQRPDLIGGVYSEGDRQVDPTALTQALVTAAQRRGVRFRFDAAVDAFLTTLTPNPSDALDSPLLHCTQVCWAEDSEPADIVVITAGLGSMALTRCLQTPLEVRPVLGQALQVWLPRPLGGDHLQPVVTGQDIHIVPLLKPWMTETELSPKAAEYWVGATVELPDDGGMAAIADKSLLDQVWRGAIALCPDLAQGEIVRAWSGLRPRPQGRPAPILETLQGYDNVLLATGHYRNGVLLAPASARWVVDQITR